jgi:hypothetical protein
LANRTRTPAGQTGRPVVLQLGIPKDVGSGAKRNVEPEDAGTNGCNEKREKTTVVLIDGLSIAPLSWDTTQTRDVQLLFAKVLMPPKAYFFQPIVYFTHDGESSHKGFMDHDASAAHSI